MPPIAALVHGRHVGQLRARASPVTASARSLPPSTCCSTLAKLSKYICIWPASRSVIDGRRAAIGHVHDVGAGQRLEHLADEMRLRAEAGRGEVHLAGIGLGVGHELAHRLRRHRGVDHQQQRALRHHRDRREALQRVVAGVPVDQRADDHRSGRAEQQACGRRVRRSPPPWRRPSRRRRGGSRRRTAGRAPPSAGRRSGAR